MVNGFSYTDLLKKYRGFGIPMAQVIIDGEDLTKNKAGFMISYVEVELCSGFESSIAEIHIYKAHNEDTGFLAKELSDLLEIGSRITISLGYSEVFTEVFHGFIAGVSYQFTKGDFPCVVVTSMDVKGIMMANNYSTQLKAKSYGEAVKEILQKPLYAKVYKSLEITDTPDKQETKEFPERTMEMTAESDYEFIVKAAKKFNYEFFVQGGIVYFRKSKSKKEAIATLSPGGGMTTFEVGYNVSGLVDEIEVRALNSSLGKDISHSAKRSGDLSLGSKATSLLSKSKKIYIDPSAQSSEMAKARVESLLETMTDRFGSLRCECVGIPEIIPGHFLQVEGLGKGVDNKFYMIKVTHVLGEEGYRTQVVGSAQSLPSGGL